MKIYLDDNDWKHVAQIRSKFADHIVKSGDFTCVDGSDEYEGAILLNAVQYELDKLDGKTDHSDFDESEE